MSFIGSDTIRLITASEIKELKDVRILPHLIRCDTPEALKLLTDRYKEAGVLHVPLKDKLVIVT